MPRVVPSQVVQAIDKLFPEVKNQVEDPSEPLSFTDQASDMLAAIASLIDQIPDELLILDANQYSNLLASTAAIHNSLAMWRGGERLGRLGKISGLSELNPVTLIRQALVNCPDEYPPEETPGLEFIDDEKLRQSLRIDMAATEKALSNGEWKAATVLGGSVIEALLLWKLEQRLPAEVSHAIRTLCSNSTFKRNPGTNLETWHLHDYIEVAAELDEISEDIATQAKLAKNFRNLIHPGRTQRLGQVCDRGTAYSAVAAVHLVIRDLTL